MTRVLVDDPNRAPRARRDWLHDLAQVAHPRRECLRPTRPQRVRRQDVAVRLEVRAASRGIDYHLPVGPREGVDVVPGELTRAFAVAGVRVQGAAPDLLLGDADAVPVALEKAHRRALGLSESLAHDAAREEAHVGVIPIDAAEGRAFGRRSQRRDPAEAAGQSRGEARESEAGAEVGKACRDREAPWTRDRVEHRARGAATALPLTQHLARAFHDPTERHKGWARGLAGAAHQTRFEMFDGRLARRGRTFEDGADHLDASAR